MEPLVVHTVMESSKLTLQHQSNKKENHQTDKINFAKVQLQGFTAIMFDLLLYFTGVPNKILVVDIQILTLYTKKSVCRG